MSDPLLTVDDLHTHIRTAEGLIRAADGVSLTVDRGETVCLVGESGSGKTVTCESITQLLPSPPAEYAGRIHFDGTDLLDASPSTLQSIRGDRIAHVFQNPTAALDPVYPVGEQIAEAITLHYDVSDRVARRRAIDLLHTVGISRGHERVDDYPHEFSDGMCQRIAIAIAIAAEPALLIADEPTSAVDVTIQARLLELLDELQREQELAMLLVTHDLRVVAALADYVVVLYGGRVMERGPVERVFERPSHPYTQALFRSFTAVDPDGTSQREPLPTNGCRFHRECPHAIEECRDGSPTLEPLDDDATHRAACVFHEPERDSSTVLEHTGALGISVDEGSDNEVAEDD